MNETKTPITAEATESVAERVKPYTLRPLKAEDVFLMTRIIGKIGINEFKNCISKDSLENIVDIFTGASKTDDETTDTSQENMLVSVGVTLMPSVLDIVNVIICNMEKCETDVYKFLANISNFSVEEIKKLDFVDFTEMVIDLVKKEEFKDFIKVVSKLFK